MKASPRTPAKDLLDGAVEKARRALAKRIHTAGGMAHTRAYSWQMAKPIAALETLIGAGRAQAVADITFEAMRVIDDVAPIPTISFGGDDGEDVPRVLRRLERVHLLACSCVRPAPDGVALAETLFETWHKSKFGLFLEGDKTYASLLKARGLERYGQLALALWERVRDDPSTTAKHLRFPLEHALTRIAERTDNFELLLRVRGGAGGVSDVVRFLRKRHRYDELLDRMERARVESGGEAAVRLELAKEYQRRGRHRDAAALVLDHYVERPCPDRRIKLRSYCKQAGGWDEWRDRVYSGLVACYSTTDDFQIEMAARDEHIEMLVGDRKPLTAAQVALGGRCSTCNLAPLVRRLRKKHPATAIELLRRLVETRSYVDDRERVAAVRGLRDLEIELGNGADFAKGRDSILARTDLTSALRDALSRAMERDEPLRRPRGERK